MSGEQLTRGSQADADFAWVYIGGIPSRYADPEEVPVLEGFIGCMKSLIVSV